MSDLLIQKQGGIYTVTLNRPDIKNSLTPIIVRSLLNIITDCEMDTTCRCLRIRSSGDHYCNGMDLAEAGRQTVIETEDGRLFGELLNRITRSSVIVIAEVQGHVKGGGVGLVAACDFVFCEPHCEFSLPELLWGLTPYTVAPFIIRRCGHQVCRRMTLSTLPISARDAKDCGLVDSTELNKANVLLRRIQMVASEGIGKAKHYLHGLWSIDQQMLDNAVTELNTTLNSPEVQERLRSFAESNRFPWELNSRTHRSIITDN